MWEPPFSYDDWVRRVSLRLCKLIAERCTRRLVFAVIVAGCAGGKGEGGQKAKAECFDQGSCPLCGEFAKHVLENAAIAVILHLVLCIYTTQCGEVKIGSIAARCLDDDVLARL